MLAERKGAQVECAPFDDGGRIDQDAYRKALAYINKRIEDHCISREADYQLVSTKDELKDILLNSLAKKGVIK